jgi:hypothetical protein
MPVSHAARYAIWEAYGGRCIYCGDLVRYRDVELDHIVPRSVTADDLRALLVAAGLSSDWDVKGLQNTVPSCRSCNRTKSNHRSSPRQVLLLTTIAEARLPLVRSLSEKFARQASADRVRALLEEALAGGTISWQDINEHRPADDARCAIRLSAPVEISTLKN